MQQLLCHSSNRGTPFLLNPTNNSFYSHMWHSNALLCCKHLTYHLRIFRMHHLVARVYNFQLAEIP